MVAADRTAVISGTVRLFDGTPLPGAEVRLLDSRFQTVAQAIAGESGEYSMAVAPGDYPALIALKDYRTKYLEFWAWNPRVETGREIHARIGGLELYGLTAWRVPGAYPAIFLYVRPMSLHRFLRQEGTGESSDDPTTGIAPPLDARSVQVLVGDTPVELLRVTPVDEVTGPGSTLRAYVLQAALPEGVADSPELTIRCVLRDVETGEQGEAICYLRRRPSP